MAGPQTIPAIRALGRQVVELIARAFVDAGCAVEREIDVSRPADQVRVRADLLVTCGARKWAIEVRAGRDNRRTELRQRYSEAAIRSQVAARRLGAEPLPIVGSPRLTDAVIDDIKRYADTFTPDRAFGLADSTGRVELFGPGLPALPSVREPPERPAMARIPHGHLFTDLNQWVAKVLLASRLPSGLLNAPARTYQSVSDLAAAADVSGATAWRAVDALESHGFAEIRHRRISLVRLEELMTRWKNASQTAVDVPVSLRLPVRDAPAEIRKRMRRLPGAPGPRRVALGLFAACAELGYGFVAGAPTHLLVDVIDDELLDSLGIALAPTSGAPDLFLRVPPARESAFRGSVSRDGIATADVVQCWLDVSQHPARGTAQAERLWKRVFAPLTGAHGR